MLKRAGLEGVTSTEPAPGCSVGSAVRPPQLQGFFSGPSLPDRKPPNLTFKTQSWHRGADTPVSHAWGKFLLDGAEECNRGRCRSSVFSWFCSPLSGGVVPAEPRSVELVHSGAPTGSLNFVFLRYLLPERSSFRLFPWGGAGARLGTAGVSATGPGLRRVAPAGHCSSQGGLRRPVSRCTGSWSRRC